MILYLSVYIVRPYIKKQKNKKVVKPGTGWTLVGSEFRKLRKEGWKGKASIKYTTGLWLQSY